MQGWLNWLKRGASFWIGTSVIFLVPLTVHWVVFLGKLGDTKDEIQVSGLILEFFGVVVVAYGIMRRAATFDGPTIFQKIRSYFESMPVFSKNIVLEPKSAALKATASAAGVSATGHASGHKTVEARLDSIEAQLRSIRGDFKTHVGNLRELDQKTTRQMQDIRTQIEEIRGSLKSVSGVEELDIEYMGIAWVLVGLVLASIPELLVGVGERLQAALCVAAC